MLLVMRLLNKVLRGLMYSVDQCETSEENYERKEQNSDEESKGIDKYSQYQSKMCDVKTSSEKNLEAGGIYNLHHQSNDEEDLSRSEVFHNTGLHSEISDTIQSSDLQAEYLRQGARPKVCSSKPTETKKPNCIKNPAVEFYDWSNKCYKEIEPLLVRVKRKSKVGNIQSITSVAQSQSTEEVLFKSSSVEIEQVSEEGLTFGPVLLEADKANEQLVEVSEMKYLGSIIPKSETLKSHSEYTQCDLEDTFLSDVVDYEQEQEIIKMFEQVGFEDINQSLIVSDLCDAGVSESSVKKSKDNKALNVCIESVEASSVTMSQTASCNKSAMEHLQNGGIKADDVECGRSLQRQYQNRLYSFMDMHFRYSCDIIEEIFYVQDNRVFLHDNIMNFLVSEVSDYRLCGFILHLYSVLHCTLLLNRPEFCDNLIYNRYVGATSVLNVCLVDLLTNIQSTSMSFCRLKEIMHYHHVQRFPTIVTCYSSNFFSDVLQLLRSLASVKSGSTNCSRRVLNFAIVSCAIILGSMYSKMKVTSSRTRVNEDNKHTEVFGLMCYYVLYKMQYMYDVHSNMMVVIDDLYFPSMLIEQCSVNFLNIAKARIASDSMDFDVIMDDLTNSICLLMTKDNLAAFEQHIKEYACVYDSLVYDLDKFHGNAR
ncbi:DUF3514 domain-containing protein [Ehrlichia minasensis]|uniref:DUF3514 domain-containing protein n=2 Tax=Ehrlichia minasensis TaxID=1242993 RepID=A0A4Q6I3I3_9RICK|nr:DUF3514 domain-containing protein [Ehrlichia minasensis]